MSRSPWASGNSCSSWCEASRPSSVAAAIWSSLCPRSRSRADQACVAGASRGPRGGLAALHLGDQALAQPAAQGARRHPGDLCGLVQGQRSFRHAPRKLLHPRDMLAPAKEGRERLRCELLRYRRDRFHRTPPRRGAAASATGPSTCWCARARAGRSTRWSRTWAPTRGGSSPSPATCSRTKLGVEDFDEKIDHLFHLAAVYDMEADEDASEKANVQGTRNVIEFANSHDVGRFHHVSSIAVAGSYKGVFQEDMFDEDQKLPHHYHRTKYESEAMVRRDVKAQDPGLPPGHGRRPLRDGRHGQGRRPVLHVQPAQEAARRAARVVPAGGARGRQDHDRPGRLRGQGDGPHRPPARRRPAGRHLPPGRPRPDDHRRGAEHVRPCRARAADGHARGREPDPGRARRGALGDHGAAHGQEDPRPALRRPGHPPGGHGGARLQVHVRRARHPARPGRHRHRGAAAGLLRRQGCGTTGSATWTRRCSGTARWPRPSRTSA